LFVCQSIVHAQFADAVISYDCGNSFFVVTNGTAAGARTSGAIFTSSGSTRVVGAGFDLSWAQDGKGNSIDLPSVDYIRIDVLSGRTQIDAVSSCLHQQRGRVLWWGCWC